MRNENEQVIQYSFGIVIFMRCFCNMDLTSIFLIVTALFVIDRSQAVRFTGLSHQQIQLKTTFLTVCIVQKLFNNASYVQSLSFILCICSQMPGFTTILFTIPTPNIQTHYPVLAVIHLILSPPFPLAESDTVPHSSEVHATSKSMQVISS